VLLRADSVYGKRPDATHELSLHHSAIDKINQATDLAKQATREIDRISQILVLRMRAPVPASALAVAVTGAVHGRWVPLTPPSATHGTTFFEATHCGPSGRMPK
jgi:hypothetical protein